MRTTLNSASIYVKCYLMAGLCFLLMWPLGMHAQGGLMIGSGAQVVATASPSIVITDGKWQNDGAFIPALSLVRVEGSTVTSNSTIGGIITTTFYDLTQQKSANNVLLTQNIQVSNSFTMNGGLFLLNNFDVTLGTATGQVLNESETNRITGITGGFVQKTMTLNAPAGLNPGNLGATITSAANMGSTLIRRGHVQQTDGNGGLSIYRFFDIVPTNNTGLAATLRQSYFDAELGGRLETELEHYNSLNNGFSWYARGFTARNIVSNFVDKTGYPDLATRWTLASPINQPLPVVFLDQGLRCESDHATLFWTVMESAGSDHFQVEKSADEVEWVALADGMIASEGVGRNRYTYVLSESAPFFRVRQVDVNGTSVNGESQKLTCNIAGEWAIWPNPTTAELNIKAPFGQTIASLEVSDMFGQVILRHAVVDAPQYTLALNDQLASAMYTIRVIPSKGNPIVKKFEVRH